MGDNALSIPKILFGSAIGNAIEWYNFLVYGVLSHYIATLFFPHENKYLSLILTFAVFAIGFLARPIGAFIFGIIGDKKGRKTALLVSINLMILSTILMAILPTYYQVGILAPILLLLFRILQGISVGGEYTSSIVYIGEHANNNKRGFYISFMPLTITLGILLGTIVSLIFISCLSHETMLRSGWRIVFLLGAVFGIVGIFARKKLPETDTFEKLKCDNLIASHPIKTLIQKHRVKLLLSFIIVACYGIQYQILYIWMNQYLHHTLNIENTTALTVILINLILFVVLSPIYGMLVDKFSSEKILLSCVNLDIVIVYPLFLLLNTGYLLNIYIATLFLTLIFTGVSVSLPTFLVDYFPANLRLSGISVSYNLAFAIFGGTSPLVATWLINLTHNLYMPGFYLIFSSICALAALLYYKKTQVRNNQN